MGEIFRFESIIIRLWSSMKKAEAHAKFSLDTLECFECEGFSAQDIRRIQQELQKRHEKLWEGWRQIHGKED